METPIWIAVAASLAFACGGGGESWVGADPVNKQHEPATVDTSSDPRPHSKRDLVTRALRAISSNDADAYIAMLPTSDEIQSRCPSDWQLWDNLLPNLKREIRSRIAECNQLIDFKRADSVGGKDPQTKSSGCDGELYKHSDVKLLFRVDAKRYRVVIDDPGEMDGIFVVNDAPLCELDD